MNTLNIAIKNKTYLTLELEKSFDVSYYEKQTFFSKLLLQEKKYPDIYFHKGSLSPEAVELIENSKIVVANAQSVRNEIIQKVSHIDIDKIKVLYPYIHMSITYDKEIKKAFKEKHKIDKKSKIIFFRGKDLTKSGLNVLLDVISRMYKDSFTLIIESTAKQITPLKLQLERSDVKFNYILFEDYNEIEELFIASDIFILPTQQKYFSLDVLRAMYFRNAVFLMEKNYASEIIDTFSLIQNEEDRSVSFKVDSLLINKDELKKIQKENQKIVSEFTLQNNFEKIIGIIKENFDN